METLGLVPGRPGVETLLALATDVAEEPAVRAAALAALGDVTTADDIDDVLALKVVADGQGALADVARAAVHDSWSAAGPVEVLTTEVSLPRPRASPSCSCSCTPTSTPSSRTPGAATTVASPPCSSSSATPW